MNFDLYGFGPALAAGALMTVKLALTALCLGLVLGLAGALAKTSPYKPLQWLGGAYSTIVRGIPELLWVLLQQSPELDSLYVANDVGRMLMVQRYPDPAVRHIVREHGTTIETWEFKPRPPEDGTGSDAQQRYLTERIDGVPVDILTVAKRPIRIGH